MAVTKRLFLCTLMSVLLSLQGGLAADPDPLCQREDVIPDTLHIDVFKELVSNHTDIVSTLNVAPVIGKMDLTAPTFEFRGAGFHLTDMALSNEIRRMSCASSEVTFYWSVFFKDSDTSGPLIELAYGDGLGTSFPVFSVFMDASADEIILAYRHLGKLHTEIFSTRLHGGKWRKYAITLSGNQVSMYVNCELAYQRIIALPDYCANDSNLILSVADSTSNQEVPDKRLSAFLQNVGFNFGPGGILNQCPDMPEACPSCGQFLQLVERVFLLNQELERLKTRVAVLESEGVTSPPDCETTPTQSVGTGDDCSVTDGNVERTFSDGTFLGLQDQSVCYCTDGVPQCDASVCESTSVPTPTDSSNTTDEDPGVSTPSPLSCTIAELGNKIIQEGDTASIKEESDCKIFLCKVGPFGVLISSAIYQCSANYSSCSSNFTDLQVEVSKCCSICNVCSFVTCPEKSQCTLRSEDSREYSCTCKTGYKLSPNGTCQDINECEVDQNSCPSNSECKNKEGSFQCPCDRGYSMAVSSNGDILCEDDDECASGDNNCTDTMDCINEPGSYRCECSVGHTLSVDGQCIPVCDPPCQNGGLCTTPHSCSCHRGYKGAYCESDINECDSQSTNNCRGPRSECVNTIGGFFCRCGAGYQGDGFTCDDIDECSTKLHNCVTGSRCLNTVGSFKCLCSETDCTGVCLYRGLVIQNKDSIVDNNCRNCTCLDGETACRKMPCNCSTNPSKKCCPQCHRRDCIIKDGTVRIRPKSTWINPQNRCERYYCSTQGKNLVPVRTDLQATCPQLDCPANMTTMPMGACCPVCYLPPCNADNNRQTVTVRNGCQTCTCLDSSWKCTQKVECPQIQCGPQFILFNKDGCCPVCAREALTTGQCET